jgi:hypothetical protein
MCHHFIKELIWPLIFGSTNAGQKLQTFKEIISEEQFWSESDSVLLDFVRLNGFRITDWFPRAPGVYWSAPGTEIRTYLSNQYEYNDAQLGSYFRPATKSALIEMGGIGAIRLRPRRLDGEDCWFATALKGNECHSGIPLAIPDALLRGAGVGWGDQVNIVGQVRFLQDAGLDDVAAYVHHTRPLIVFVDELQGVTNRQPGESIVITPVVLFEFTDWRSRDGYDRAQYTFVRCSTASDSDLDAAVAWIEKYAKKFKGRVITNFDEQRPALANAPLSYQRLVDKTYNRTVIKHFLGTVQAAHFNQTINKSVITHDYGGVHVAHNINVGGPAIINIDSMLSNVTQTIGTAPGLDSAQKSQLEGLVRSLNADLDKVKATHPDEAKEIAEALGKAVGHATKPPHERKKSVLQLSAKGLIAATKLVKDIAPGILLTANLIAKFVVGL